MVERVGILDLVATKPIESLRFQIFPEKSLKLFLVEDVKNSPENMGRITRAIAIEGGKIAIMRPSNPRGEITDILYHVECPEGKEEEIASRIEELGVCKRVLIIDMPDKRLALNVLFPYKVMGERAVVMMEAVYSGFMNGMRRRLTEGGAKAFLYLIGVEVGKELFMSIAQILRGKSLTECIETIFHIQRALGYCMLRSIKSIDDTIIIEVSDNWESSILEKRYTSPQCHLTRGIIEGFLRQLTGAKWEVNEVECLGMGDDKCVFTILRA